MKKDSKHSVEARLAQSLAAKRREAARYEKRRRENAELRAALQRAASRAGEEI